MRPREISDFLPLIGLSKLQLARLTKQNLAGKHQIYYIGDALNVHLEKTILDSIFY